MGRPLNDEEIYCFGCVIAEVRKWQEEGRLGFCLPVLRGELLDRLEKLADNWTRGGNMDQEPTAATSDSNDRLGVFVGGIKAIERIRLTVNMKLATRGTGQEQLPTNEQLAIVALADQLDMIQKTLDYRLRNNIHGYA